MAVATLLGQVDGQLAPVVRHVQAGAGRLQHSKHVQEPFAGGVVGQPRPGGWVGPVGVGSSRQQQLRHSGAPQFHDLQKEGAVKGRRGQSGPPAPAYLGVRCMHAPSDRAEETGATGARLLCRILRGIQCPLDPRVGIRAALSGSAAPEEPSYKQGLEDFGPNDR